MKAPTPNDLAITVLITGIVFTTLWYLDHRTHLAIWKKDITDGELRTHRLILLASWGLQAAIILSAFFPWVALPFVIGCWLTRLVHEGIDELHWHLPRCTERESLIHLGMWISVQTGTVALFTWAFFLRFEGFLEQPWWMLGSYAFFAIATAVIGNSELFDYKGSRIEPVLSPEPLAAE